MLGPELVNHVIRPTPLFAEGAPSLKITNPVPKELGLANFQTVNALIESQSGQLFLMINQTKLMLPEQFKRWLGVMIEMQVRQTADGLILVPARVSKPSISQAQSQQTKPETSPDKNLDNALKMPLQALSERIDQFSSPSGQRLQQWLASVALSFPPILSAHALKKMIVNNGVLAAHTQMPLASILISLLRSNDLYGRQRSVVEEMLENLVQRFEQSSTSLKQGNILFECLGLVNQTPINLTFSKHKKSPTGHSDTDRPWQAELYTQFSSDSHLWVNVVLHQQKISVTAWITDLAFFQRVQATKQEFVDELKALGLQLKELQIFNVAKGAIPNNISKVSQTVDWRV